MSEPCEELENQADVLVPIGPTSIRPGNHIYQIAIAAPLSANLPL